MDSAAEQRKESVNLKIQQQEIPNLKTKIKQTEKKKMNKPSGICGAGTKELTFLSLEFQRERRKREVLKKST